MYPKKLRENRFKNKRKQTMKHNIRNRTKQNTVLFMSNVSKT